MPVRRSQSSFSQAAALIASFSTSAAAATPAAPSYVKSPREFYLDVEANGTMRKTASASWGSLASLGSSSPCSPSRQSQDQLQMLREVSEDSDFSQSGDSAGIGAGAGAGACTNSQLLLPPHLLHQQSQTQSLSLSTAGATASMGSPNPQPRSLERCPTSSLDEQGEVDFELLEEMSRQAGHSWLGLGVGLAVGMSLSRSTSASSLTGVGGRDSAVTVSVQ